MKRQIIDILIELLKVLIKSLLLPFLDKHLKYEDKLNLAESVEDIEQSINNQFDWRGNEVDSNG